MDLNNEQQTRIRNWVQQEGCAVGSVLGRSGGDLSVSLVSTVWESIQKLNDWTMIIFVRNSQAEAEVLELQLQHFQGGELGKMTERCTSPTPCGLPMTTVVIMTYQQLLNLLHHEHYRTRFVLRTVVIFEHELGPGWDENMAREQVALIAKTFTTTNVKGAAIKILGLSYHAASQTWLNSAACTMTGARRNITLHVVVEGSQANEPSWSTLAQDDTQMREAIKRACYALKHGYNVISLGGTASGLAENILTAARAELTKKSPSVRAKFETYDDSMIREETGEAILPDWFSTLFNKDHNVATMVSIPFGVFSTPLPLSKVGLVIVLGGPEPVTTFYTPTCASVASQQWPSQLEYGLHTRMGCWSEEDMDVSKRIILRCFSDEEFNKCPKDTRNTCYKQEQNPLRTWLQAVHAYQGKSLEEMPEIESRVESEMHHTLLQIMGLVKLEDRRLSLTPRGQDTVSLMATFSLETAVMCAYAEGLGTKLSMCIRRLALIGESWNDLFTKCGFVAGETTLAEFQVALHGILSEIGHGGPGIRLTDKGCLWMVWVVLEDAEKSLIGIRSKPEFILPRAEGLEDGSVFQIITAGLEMIQAAEQEIGALLQVRSEKNLLKTAWGQPLTKEEETEIDRAFITAFYPKLLGVTIAKNPDYICSHPFFMRTGGQVGVSEAWDALLIQASKDNPALSGARGDTEMAIGVASCRDGLYTDDEGRVQAFCLVLIALPVWFKFMEENTKYVDRRLKRLFSC